MHLLEFPRSIIDLVIGNAKAANITMIAMTTRSSTSVNAALFLVARFFSRNIDVYFRGLCLLGVKTSSTLIYFHETYYCQLMFHLFSSHSCNVTKHSAKATGWGQKQNKRVGPSFKPQRFWAELGMSEFELAYFEPGG